MALVKDVKQELARRVAAGEIPEEREVRSLLEKFLSLSGYTEGEIADAIGYSRSAVTLFRMGRYGERAPGVESNSSALRAKLKEFIEPFFDAYESASRERNCTVYRTGNYQLVRKAFYKAVDHGRAYCVDGAPGTRKTFLLKTLIRELRQLDAAKNGHGRRAVYVRCRYGIQPKAMLQRIANALGVPSRGDIDQLVRKIQFHLMARRAVLVLDEAHLLGIECLEVLRELLDEPPYIGLVLAGSHEIQERFRQLQMEQWRSRVPKTIELRKGVERDEAIAMICGELGDRYPKTELKQIVESFRVQDFRRQHARTCRCDECSYISARSLFIWIDEVRMGLQQREKGGNA
jgi:DNA transposition AAA+ family ATPase